MKVAGRPKLKNFYQAHSRAKKPLLQWLEVVEAANWHRFADVKRIFNTADWYSSGNKNHIIFNVGGNKYRVITAISFEGLVVIVKIVMTHGEYSKNK